MGHPPLIRIDAARRDPVDAYRRHRDRLLALKRPSVDLVEPFFCVVLAIDPSFRHP
jgi:hypothetical protein